MSRPSPFILVVDDSADVREILADVLADGGYDVQTVASAPRALAAMAERIPDLVITDLLMPGMSGFALRGRMLKSEELTGIPVVVLSAYWHRPGETLDAAEVLTKPIDFERLTETVARLTGWEPCKPAERQGAPTLPGTPPDSARFASGG